MKKSVFIALLLAFSVTSAAIANPVDQKVAKDIGAKYLSVTVGTRTAVSDLTLAKTYFMADGNAALYVFSTNNSYVIVSAHDEAIPILGYSDEGPFDANNIPENMEWWLQDYACQIQYGVDERQIDFDKTAKEWAMVKQTGRLGEERGAMSSVEPLLGDIRWNQGKYYNSLCPESDVSALGMHTYAGCVACATSQIMRKWQHPTTGTGSHTSAGDPVLTVDFGTYDWENMPVALTDGYNILLDGITEPQILAVATLMYHVGVAVDMRYGSNGSSAYSDAVPHALKEHFGYSDEMELEKLVYNADQITLWKVKLRSSLNHNCPMYYSGATGNMGHAFVCDGYNADGEFHINWGYSGTMNGYFAIGALNYNPSSQYNSANDAIFNIHPDGTTTTFSISVAANNSDYGSVSKTGSGVYGTNVTVTATPQTGYHFCYWSVDGVNVSEDQTYTFKAKYDQDLVAVFAPPFLVTAVSTDDSFGTVTGSGTFAYGTMCTLKATPTENHVFVNWTLEGTPVSTNSSYTFKVTGTGEYVANFISIEGVHVGSGESTNAHYPLTGGYEYSLSEQIYTPSQLGTETALLGSVAFFNAANSEKIRDLAIYMRHTDKSTFGSLTDWIPLTEDDKVFEGEVTFAASGWTVIDFTNLFAYNGFENVVLAVDDNTGSLATPNLDFKVDGVGGSSNVSMYLNQSSNVDPLSPPKATLRNDCRNELYVKSFSPAITFSISASAYPKSTGSIDGTGDGLAYGSSCTLTATAYEGYVFDSWTNSAGKVVSKTASYSFEVKNNLDLVANFRGIYDLAFVDDEVKALCVENWDTDNDGELSYYEASIVDGLGNVFKNNTTITSFDELRYFTRLTTIGNNAFDGCSNLASVTIPENVTSIGDYAFRNCKKLEPITIPAGVNSIGNNAFEYCDGLTSLELPMGLLSIGSSAFSFCEYLTSINIPNTVTTIGSAAFSNCKRLTGSLVIPNSVTTLGSGAFSGCKALDGTLTLSEGLTSISGNMFYNCSGLKGSLIIPDGVTSINYDAFNGCSGLNGPLVIGESLSSIGSNVFHGCANITAVISKRSTPPSTSAGCFTGMSFSIPVYVPNATALTYQAADGWNQFTNYKEQIITSNWSSPSSEDVVCVDGNYVLEGNATALYIIFSDAEKVLTIPDGFTLTVMNGIETISASQLVVKDGGQLICNSEVPATVEKSIEKASNWNTSGADGWYFIASPVDRFSTSTIATGTNNSDLYSYDEESGYWFNAQGSTHPFATLSRGQGYLYANFTGNDLSFIGEMQAANTHLEKNLSYKGSGSAKGCNLLGNPFTYNLTDENVKIQKGGVVSSITPFYIVENGADLAVITDATFNENPIKPGRGFLVQADGENQKIVFNPSAKAEGTSTKPTFVCIEAGNDRFMDCAYVQIGQGNTLRKLTINHSVPHVYVMNEGKDYAVATVVEAQGEIPVCFKAAQDGQYTITVRAEEVETGYLHLIDNITGANIDLLATSSYTFSAKADDYESRFSLVFSANNDNKDNFAFISNGQLIVTGEGILQVVDMLGRVISTETVNGTSSKTINVKAGVYVLRLINGESVKTQKIVIK